MAISPRRVEVWSLPDDPEGFRALQELPAVSATLNEREDTPGMGTVLVPGEYEFLSQILDFDPADVPAAIYRLVAVFTEDDAAVPEFEFLADERTDKIGPGLTQIAGPHIDAALNDGKVYPRSPSDPIWLWGQPTVTRNADLAEGLVGDEEFDVWIVATAGTWRVSLNGGTDYTANLDWDEDSAVALKSAIEAVGAFGIAEVNVTGSGAWDDPFKIHVVDPAQTNFDIQVDDSSLTGTISVRFVTDGGDVKPTYWTPRQTVEGVLHGVMGTFRVEDDPLDGLPSLLVAGNSAYIGGQQILDGVGGLHGYATVDVRPLVYGANFRIGIRALDESWIYTVEDFIDEGVGYVTLTIPDVELPKILDQIILMGAVIDDAPPDFYMRNLRLHRGRPGTTFGDIATQLVAAAQTRDVLAWLDMSTFDEIDDSNEDPWDDDNLTWRADPGQDLGTHLMSFDAREAGYEYEIVRKATPVGALTHDLKAYNPNGRGTVYDIDPAVVVGDITSGQLVKRRISYTHLLVEYGDLQFVTVTHLDFAAMPRREGFLRAEQALTEATAIKIGEQHIADQLDDRLATQIVPTSELAVRVGDTIRYTLGDLAGSHTRRIHTKTTKLQNDVWSQELTGSRFFPTGGDGMSAVWESINHLYRLFGRRRSDPKPKAILPQLATGCCPACPAQYDATATSMIQDFPDLNWTLDVDPDSLMAINPANGNLSFRRPGLYTCHLSLAMTWTITTGGWASWEVFSLATSNDAGNGLQTVTSAAPATSMRVRASLFHYAHLATTNKRYSAGWEMVAEQSAGLVNVGTLNTCHLTVVRHSPGCAVEQGCG